MAAKLLEKGLYVVAFSFPVVPKGLARIRVQISAGHEKKHLDKAIAAFTKIGKEHFFTKRKDALAAIKLKYGDLVDIEHLRRHTPLDSTER